MAGPSENFIKLLLSILSRYAAQFPSIKLWMAVVDKARKDAGLPEIVVSEILQFNDRLENKSSIENLKNIFLIDIYLYTFNLKLLQANI